MLSLERFPAFNQNFRNLGNCRTNVSRIWVCLARLSSFWEILDNAVPFASESCGKFKPGVLVWMEGAFKVLKNRQQKNMHACKPVLHQIRLLTGLNVGGKTCNIAFQLVLQQCCKRSCMFFVARFSVPLVVYTPWCFVARILRTARGLIGYFEVTWHRTIEGNRSTI